MKTFNCLDVTAAPMVIGGLVMLIIAIAVVAVILAAIILIAKTVKKENQKYSRPPVSPPTPQSILPPQPGAEADSAENRESEDD